MATRTGRFGKWCFLPGLTVLAFQAPAQEPTNIPDPTKEPSTFHQLVVDEDELPADFPADVPLYQGMASPTVARVDVDKVYVVKGQTPDSGREVSRGIQESMVEAGWQRIMHGQTIREEQMTFLKDERRVGVVLHTGDQVTRVRMRVPIK